MLRAVVVALYRCYAIAAFVVVVLLLFCPILIMAPSLPMRRAIGRVTVRAWLLVIGVRFRVIGLKHLPDGPCVALCNHASYVDGIVLTAALPTHFNFLVQHRAANWPYVGLIIRRMGVSFVNRESPVAAGLALRRMIRSTRSGESWAIFPEGRFRQEPGLMPFYGGAFLIAAKAQVPVVPGVMRGTRWFFGEGQWLPRWSRIDIELFPPIAAASTHRKSADALRDAAYAVMLQHCGERSASDMKNSESADQPGAESEQA